MELINIRTGDQFLIRSESFLSKSIRKAMKLYAKQKDIEIADDDIYSHAGFFIRHGPKLMIAEAIKNGYKIRNFDKYYNLGMDCCIMRLKWLPEEHELEKMINEAYRLQSINWGYQYQNFIQWLSYIFFRADFFIDNDQWIYCFEGNYRIYHTGRSWSFSANPEMTDYFKLFDLTRFNVLHKTK